MTAKREAHLAMIQGVVTRLGQNSFLLKGWSVLLVSALLALGAASSEELVLLVAFLPVLAFWDLMATSSGRSGCSERSTITFASKMTKA